MNEFAKNFILVIAIFLIIVGFATLFYKEPTAPKNIALTQLATDINAGNVSKITVNGNDRQCCLQ